jgi:hypothetical protein
MRILLVPAFDNNLCVKSGQFYWGKKSPVNCSKPRTSADKTTNKQVGVHTFAENKGCRLTTLFANVTTLSENGVLV